MRCCVSSSTLTIKYLIMNMATSMLQTIFIILVCNNQLLHWVVENEFIGLVSLIHGSEFVLPKLIDKVNKIRNKYLAAPPSSKVKVFFSLCENYP